MTNALIFDCDGVLADTERDGHLPAFNAAFAEAGLPLRWSEDTYGELLAIGGGKERLAAALTPALATRVGLRTPAERTAYIAKLHLAKTNAFRRIVASGTLPPRPGVVRLARELHERGWRLAIASTSAEPSVRAVLHSVAGDEFARSFEVFAGDIVPRKKPAPDIYRLALERLGIAARAALVIEDSRNGLLAATGANLRCLVTRSTYTQNEPMDEAVLVVSSLGEPGGERTRVFANRSGAQIGDYVTAADLIDCLASAPSAMP